jgi:hypothetical protein
MRCCNRRSKTTGLIVDPQDSLVYGDRPPHLSGRHKEGREAVNSFFTDLLDTPVRYSLSERSLKLRPVVKGMTEQNSSRRGYLWNRKRSEKQSSTVSVTCITARDYTKGFK